ncbi:MAG: hypothetical protein LZT29_04267 (plasmid) [Pantoea stewartii]|nr:MAG: hypothetical protein LZT29_04267 [Pantoea stewartii]
MSLSSFSKSEIQANECVTCIQVPETLCGRFNSNDTDATRRLKRFLLIHPEFAS